MWVLLVLLGVGVVVVARPRVKAPAAPVATPEPPITTPAEAANAVERAVSRSTPVEYRNPASGEVEIGLAGDVIDRMRAAETDGMRWLDVDSDEAFLRR